MHLLNNFETLSWNDSIYQSKENMSIHEFGHVLDNIMQNPQFGEATWFGMGPADALLNFVGGQSTSLLRFLKGLSIPLVEDQFIKVAGFGYGNSSTADYFAHSFTAAIVAPGDPNAPRRAVMWVSALINITQ